VPTARAVGFVEPASGRQSDVATKLHPEAVATISAWSAASGYDAAIRTALKGNFDEWDKGLARVTPAAPPRATADPIESRGFPNRG
jgi:hypothetical protein